MTMKECGKCGVVCKITKKGYNKKGQQRWLCSSCKKSFVLQDSPIIKKPVVKKPVVKKPVVKKPVVKPEKIITTKILVNSNEVKSVHKDITEDEAFEMISSYFKEITKTVCQINYNKIGDKTIQFLIKVGKKG